MAIATIVAPIPIPALAPALRPGEGEDVGAVDGEAPFVVVKELEVVEAKELEVVVVKELEVVEVKKLEVVDVDVENPGPTAPPIVVMLVAGAKLNSPFSVVQQSSPDAVQQ
jgi:hypothetical protein